jgi:hypothetical protein
MSQIDFDEPSLALALAGFGAYASLELRSAIGGRVRVYPLTTGSSGEMPR